MKKKNIINLILKYSLCFIIVSLFIVFLFNEYGKSFLYDYDGLGQHIITLKYFRNMLLSKNLNTYLFNIGLGMDMFGNLAYYSFGDILNYFSVFVKEESLVTFYTIINFVRVYFIGISFIIFCLYKKIKRENSILIGSLLYTFCTYSLAEFSLQPFFMNGLIIFPLLIISLDEIIDKNKKILLPIIVAIMFINNYYFGVLLSICGGVYGIIKIIIKYKNVKDILKNIFKVFIYALIGVLLSSFILLPTLSSFINSNRIGGLVKYSYSLLHYEYLILSLITPTTTNEAYLGLSVVGIVLFLFSIKDYKKYKEIFIFLIAMFIPLLVPFIGSAFNLFTYPLLRFSFVIVFFMSYLSTRVIDENKSINKKDYKRVGIILGIYFILCFLVVLIIKLVYGFPYYRSTSLYINILLCIIYFVIYCFKNKINKCFELLTILLIIVSIIINIYFLYTPKFGNYISYYVDKNYNEYLETNGEFIDEFKSAIDYIKEKDDSIYRISFDKGTFNIGLYYNFNTISAYYSILPHNLDVLTYELDSLEYATNHMDNLDNREKLLTLLNVKYFIASEEENYYGFKLINKIDNTFIYENMYYLPYGVYYDKSISYEKFNELNSVYKEDSLIKYVVLDDDYYDSKYSSKVEYDSSLEEVKFNIIDNKIYKMNKFDVKSYSESLKFNINSNKSGYYYIFLKDLKLNSLYLNDIGKKIPYKNYTVKFNIDGKEINKEYYDTSLTPYNHNSDNLLITLGYFDGINSNIELTIDPSGQYSFDSFKVYVSSYETYESDINNLNKSNFERTDIDNNVIKGISNSNEDGVLVFSTTYSDNYSVYVDDKKVDTFVANKYFLGINIDKGKHDIKIVYKTKYKSVGLIISLVSLMVLIILGRRKVNN